MPAITARCMELDLTWEHVSTAPTLPVEHETLLTVQCRTGLMSKGGNQLKCLYGEIVPVSEPPLCGIIGMLNKDIITFR